MVQFKKWQLFLVILFSLFAIIFSLPNFLSKETLKISNFKNIKLNNTCFKIKGYDKIITNQEEYDEYMKLYSRTKYKSAKKIL